MTTALEELLFVLYGSESEIDLWEAMLDVAIVLWALKSW